VVPTEKHAQYTIAPARWPEDAERARTLLANYGRYLASDPTGSTGICITGYDAELRGLPGKYAGNDADLLLATVQGEPAGCAAVSQRVLADGTVAAEMKRLWVEPRFRGLGLGRGLVNAAIAWTRAQGYTSIVLDTVSEAMPEASELYFSLGFQEISRFNDNPVSGVRFFQLMLPS
jgi:putative acetyltransferase